MENVEFAIRRQESLKRYRLRVRSQDTHGKSHLEWEFRIDLECKLKDTICGPLYDNRKCPQWRSPIALSQHPMSFLLLVGLHFVQHHILSVVFF